MTQIGQSVGAGCSSYGGSQANEAALGDQAKFQQSIRNNEKTSGKTASPSSKAAAGGSSLPLADEAKAPSEEQVQKEMFETFAKDLDPKVQKRLSTWLPEALTSDKAALKKTLDGLSDDQRKDLNTFSRQQGGYVIFKGASSDGASSKNDPPSSVYDKDYSAKNLSTLQQAFGEHALKASTPALAPTVSYDTSPTLNATHDAVYEKFVSGVSAAEQEQLAEWLPDVLTGEKSGRKAAKKLSNKEEDALEALAKAHGIEALGIKRLSDKERLEQLETAFKRDLALETAGELPTVVDMMLVHHDGKGDNPALDIKVPDDNINARVAQYEKAGFGALDSWLPAALAGRGEIPKGDAEAMALLNSFAANMGFEGGPDATPEEAFAYLDKSGFIEKALHAGSTDKKEAFLLFSDSFLDSTLKYGAKNGALNQEMVADAADVAEMLLGPDDGSNAPRQIDTQALMAAVLHRTGEPLERQQEIMAAAGYINKAESLGEQKTRLAETVLAFHVREKIGTPPMTARQWGESYAEVSPELYDQINHRAFNSPTSEKMQIITAHLGVPGDHKFMIDEKRKVKISNDDLGNVESFDLKKKKTKWYKSVIDVAVPVIATALTFTGWGTAAGIALNAGYSAYKGAQAIKNGDLLGGGVSIVGAIPGAGVVANGARVASGALQTYRAIENKDWLGALAGGLGTAATGGAGRGFQTAATGVNAGRAIESGDFLEAGTRLASMASDLSRPDHNLNQPNNLQDPHNSASLAFNTLSSGLDVADGIQEGNYAQIGGGLSNGIEGFGQELDYERRYAEEMSLQPEFGVGGGPAVGGTNGETAIRPAGYTDPNGPQSIEVAGGDTLSQIAARHGTTVEALMAANPGLADPNRIHAGQQLSLPRGVQPVGAEQQQRLQDFADSQGGPSHLPSPPRPGQGDPMLQPGATHPNAGGSRLTGRDAAAVLADNEYPDAIRMIAADVKDVDQELATLKADLQRAHDQETDPLHPANPAEKATKMQRYGELLDERRALVEQIGPPPSDPSLLSEVGHVVLDVIGLAPVIGEWADATNALWYTQQGRYWEASLSASATLPIAGIAATLGKWGIQLGKVADDAVLKAAEKLNAGTQDGIEALQKAGHSRIAEIASKVLPEFSKASAETSARIQKLMLDHGSELTKEKGLDLPHNLRATNNVITKNLKTDELIGAVRDNHDLPAIRTHGANAGKPFNHLNEVNNSLRRLDRTSAELANELNKSDLSNNYREALRTTLDAVDELRGQTRNFRDLK